MKIHGEDTTEVGMGRIIVVVAILMVAYQMASSVYHFISPIPHLAVHLGFALTLVFLNFLRTSKKYRSITLFLLLISIALSLYVFTNASRLSLLTGSIFIPMYDLLLGGVLIVILLEAMRKCFGWTLTTVVVIFILYNFFGYLLPYPLRAPQFTLTEVLGRLGLGGLGEVGIYGGILRVSANTIFLFIVFGSLLRATPALRFFIQVGRLFGSKFAGGPGITAVISSSLVGTVTGSIAANIATTGSFTIPLMKSSGYRPEQAAGIEATASTGGQIMPPIMGSAAFLLADFTGIRYAKVMVMAAIPAILYYLSLFCYVLFQGEKLNIGRMTESVNYKELLTGAPVFVIPLGFIVAGLLVGLAPGFCAVVGMVTLLVVAFAGKDRPKLSDLLNVLADGAVRGAMVAVSCATLGLVVTSLTWTGLGIKLPGLVEAITGGNIVPALFLTMVVCIILGMGMPTAAVYILVAIAAVPALVRMGVPVLPAHMFTFYFGCLSFITPPVAMGSIIAAQMAGTGYMKASIEAVKVALGGFIVPFLMVFAPALLLMPDTGPIPAILSVLGSFVAVALLQVTICAHYLTQINLATRIMCGILAAVTIAAVSMGWSVAIAAIVGVFCLLTIWQWRKLQQKRGYEP
ncbi:TRAP transporter permease [Chloroflexota bacterium]